MFLNFFVRIFLFFSIHILSRLPRHASSSNTVVQIICKTDSKCALLLYNELLHGIKVNISGLKFFLTIRNNLSTKYFFPWQKKIFDNPHQGRSCLLDCRYEEIWISRNFFFWFWNLYSVCMWLIFLSSVNWTSSNISRSLCYSNGPSDSNTGFRCFCHIIKSSSLKNFEKNCEIRTNLLLLNR